MEADMPQCRLKPEYLPVTVVDTVKTCHLTTSEMWAQSNPTTHWKFLQRDSDK